MAAAAAAGGVAQGLQGEALGKERGGVVGLVGHVTARFARVTGPLLVVDAPSMLFRAFYALPDTITGADGEPVNALLGTANLILREIEEHSPRAVVLCFGPDAADYRVALFDGYHAQRPEVPETLVPQFAASPDFFEAFGWTVAVSETLEA